MNNDDINNLLMLEIIKINTHINEMDEVEEDLNKTSVNKRIWAFQWIQNREMEYAGTWSALQEQAKEDEVSFTNFVRMNPAIFNKLAEIVRPDIEKINTNYRKSIPYQMRLSITLHFLATGYYKYIFTIIYI